jgi:acetyl-CoA synthetase
MTARRNLAPLDSFPSAAEGDRELDLSPRGPAADEHRMHAALGCAVGMKPYEEMYRRSLDEPESFWSRQAETFLTWDRPFDRVMQGGFEEGNVAWFTGGRLNACYNAIDRHLPKRAKQVALVHEADEPGMGARITYEELHAQVCRVANAMKHQGVRKGDYVTM